MEMTLPDQTFREQDSGTGPGVAACKPQGEAPLWLTVGGNATTWGFLLSLAQGSLREVLRAYTWLCAQVSLLVVPWRPHVVLGQPVQGSAPTHWTVPLPPQGCLLTSPPLFTDRKLLCEPL